MHGAGTVSEAKIFRHRPDAPMNPTDIKTWVWVPFMWVFLNHQRPTKLQGQTRCFPAVVSDDGCWAIVAVLFWIYSRWSEARYLWPEKCKQFRVMSSCTGLDLVISGKGAMVDSGSIGSWEGVLTESCKLITILFELIHIIKSACIGILLFESVLLCCCTNSGESNPNKLDL